MKAYGNARNIFCLKMGKGVISGLNIPQAESGLAAAAADEMNYLELVSRVDGRFCPTRTCDDVAVMLHRNAVPLEFQGFNQRLQRGSRRKLGKFAQYSINREIHWNLRVSPRSVGAAYTCRRPDGANSQGLSDSGRVKEPGYTLRESWHYGAFAVDLAIQGHQSVNRFHPWVLESALTSTVGELIG